MSVQRKTNTAPAGGSFWDKQDQNSISYKFQLYDKNKDGWLDKVEFKSFLKDIFSTQTSTQFLEDAIEETVWRVQRVDLVTATQAVDNIRDTFQVDSKPASKPVSATYTLSKPPVPFNAQGQMQNPPPVSVPPTSKPSDFNQYNQYNQFNPFSNQPNNQFSNQSDDQFSNQSDNQFNSQSNNQYNNQYNQLNPFMSSVPPPRIDHTPTPPPIVDPLTLPPPPLLPINSIQDFPPIPPPPNTYVVREGSLQKPTPTLLPRATNVAKPVALKAPGKVQAKMPAKPLAKAAAKVLPAAAPSLSSSGETRQEKDTMPVRLFPSSAVASHPPLISVNSEEESRAFVEYINTSVALKDDPDVKGILPISTNSTQIYQIVSEGWLLCKLLNGIQPGIIPPAQIKLHPKNAFEKIENHNLAINAARKLGCKTVNIGSEDLLQGKPRLVLGLLWQIIKRDVLSKVSLAQHPEIYKLAKNTNNLKEISECSPEEVLVKWANHHLQNAPGGKTITNFSADVKDGTTYTLLMNQVAPQVCTIDALRESDINRRALMVVENAKKLNCERFITASDIVNGNAKLNLAFVADLFNKHSGLELPTLEEMEKLKRQNANMTNILDEAEARLRQILADGQLAHELQQEEILLYRQRKLKEQEQLAEQEAMLRAEVQKEEMMMLQQQKMKEMSLKDQEQFAREEQRKEEMRVGQRQGSSSLSSSSSSSYSRTASSSSQAQSGTKAFIASFPHSTTTSTTTTSQQSSASARPTSSYQSYAPAHPTSSYQAAAPAHPPPSTYSAPAPSTYGAPAPSAYGNQHDYYSASNNNAYSYGAPPAPPYPPSTYSSAAPQAYNTQSVGPNYTTTTYGAADPNPYNVNSSYPPAPQSSSSSYVSTTQTVYTEPPITSYPAPNSPIQTRKRGVFERVGKKIDRAFH